MNAETFNHHVKNSPTFHYWENAMMMMKQQQTLTVYLLYARSSKYLYILTHLISISILSDRYYYDPHFADEGTEVQKD